MTTDGLNQQLARYCTTIDTQRALIEELQRDRDAWRDKAALPIDAPQQYRVEVWNLLYRNALAGNLKPEYIQGNGMPDAIYRILRSLVTPRADPITPRSQDAESATVLAGEKSNASHPAGGRAPAFPHTALRSRPWTPVV